jgi:hypothetical protein
MAFLESWSPGVLESELTGNELDTLFISILFFEIVKRGGGKWVGGR